MLLLYQGHKSHQLEVMSSTVVMMVLLMMVTGTTAAVAFCPILGGRGSRENAREMLIRTHRSLSTSTSSGDTSSSPSSSADTVDSKSSAEPAAIAKIEELLPMTTEPPPSLYRSQGLFAVEKPLDWTSNNVVSYIRGILERDARHRGAKPAKVTARHSKSSIVRVGHGGTLDPLATGVLVIGVGRGTKQLQSYLSGAKCYIASVELGFETTTLDMEGNVTKTAPCNHVTWQMVKDVLPQFQGSISQIPPIFSAIRKNGKKLYKAARQGVSADDLDIEPRTVDIYRIELIKSNDTVINDNHNDTDDAVLDPPRFDIEVECGGGTYIRSLVRDIGYAIDTVATTTRLNRTKQGRFLRSDCLSQEDWSADNIFAAIDRMNERLAEEEEEA